MTSAEWNAQHKVGIGVLVRLDDGRLWHTRTRSEAWELGQGQPVVMLEGKSGGYDLSRVSPMERQDIIDREITIKLAPREDGGLRVWSDDLPGLILSHPNQAMILADIGTAITILLQSKVGE